MQAYQKAKQQGTDPYLGLGRVAEVEAALVRDRIEIEVHQDSQLHSALASWKEILSPLTRQVGYLYLNC